VLYGLPPAIGPEHDSAVVLDHEQSNALGQVGGPATGVVDFATGDDQAHPGHPSVRCGHLGRQQATSARGSRLVVMALRGELRRRVWRSPWKRIRACV
jgi:hypothetical protein